MLHCISVGEDKYLFMLNSQQTGIKTGVGTLPLPQKKKKNTHKSCTDSVIFNGERPDVFLLRT